MSGSDVQLQQGLVGSGPISEGDKEDTEVILKILFILIFFFLFSFQNSNLKQKKLEEDEREDEGRGREWDPRFGFSQGDGKLNPFGL